MDRSSLNILSSQVSKTHLLLLFICRVSIPKEIGVSLSSSISNQETIKLKNSRKINQEIKRNSGIIYNQNKTNSNDPKVDQWIAPKEQDGSGKTKLNDKFGGRY